MAELTKNQFVKTAKHSAIYAFGTVLRRITGLVMLPIYTRYLTPEDYGVVELLGMAIEIASILVGFRIAQALFRYYILADDENSKKEIVSTVLITIILSSVVGVAIMLVAAEPLTIAIFGDDQYVLEFSLFTLTLITNAISAVGLSYIRARQMPVFFVVVGLITLLMQVVLNIIFVVVMELHVTGVVYSSLISGLLVAILLSAYVFSAAGFHYSISVAKALIRYVMPLIVASVGAFYVAYADKYYLRLFSGLAEVGLYALAARVSSVLSTIYEAFHMSWAADRFEIVKHENANRVFAQVFRFMSAVVIIVGAGLALFANDFFHLMTSPEFYKAGNVVPILVFAFLAQIYTIFCNFGALYRDSTRIMAMASWLKVIVATLGYLVLIPRFGMYGAAIALALSNLIELVWVHRFSSRLYDMGLEWGKVALMLFAAFLCIIGGLLLDNGTSKDFLMRLAVFGCFLAIIYALPVWNASDRSMMKAVALKTARIGKKEVG